MFRQWTLTSVTWCHQDWRLFWSGTQRVGDAFLKTADKDKSRWHQGALLKTGAHCSNTSKINYTWNVGENGQLNFVWHAVKTDAFAPATSVHGILEDKRRYWIAYVLKSTRSQREISYTWLFTKTDSTVSNWRIPFNGGTKLIQQ